VFLLHSKKIFCKWGGTGRKDKGSLTKHSPQSGGGELNGEERDSFFGFFLFLGGKEWQFHPAESLYLWRSLLSLLRRGGCGVAREVSGFLLRWRKKRKLPFPEAVKWPEYHRAGGKGSPDKGGKDGGKRALRTSALVLGGREKNHEGLEKGHLKNP